MGNEPYKPNAETAPKGSGPAATRKPTLQDQLRKLLVGIAGEDNKGIAKAQADLLESISWYRSTPRTKIADTRNYLAKLGNELRTVQTLLTGMPNGAIELFFSAYGHPKGKSKQPEIDKSFPKGKLTQEIDKAIQAVSYALNEAIAHPDRQKRIELDILACDVAIVMRDCLGMTPTSTRDTAVNVTSTRGGARYAKLLRGVLELAGFDVRSIPRKSRGLGDKDIGLLIDKGLRLLKDPSLPHNPPTKKRQ